jgi:hypothetical protein
VRSDTLPERVEAGLDGQVELGGLLAVEGCVTLCGLLGVRIEQLDVVVEQVGVEVLELLLGELDLLQRRGDLVVGQVALVVAFLNQRPQLLDVRKRGVDREHGPPRKRRLLFGPVKHRSHQVRV